jgi:hypothetical protein
LTGVAPFDKQALAEAALDEVRRMIRETEPPKPSARLQTLGEKLNEIAQRRHTEPLALTRLLRGDLDWIVMKCLEKDRNRRYETPDALGADVGRHLEGEPVSAAAPEPLYLAGKFIRRHKTGLATATALVLLLAAGAIVSTWQAVRARRAERIASEQRQKAEREAQRADLSAETEKLQRQLAEQNARKSRDVLEFIQGMLTWAGDGYADKVTVVQVLDHGVVDAELRFKDDPDALASVHYAIGYCYSKLGKWEQAAELLQGAFSERERIFGFEHPDTLDAARETASVAFSSGKAAEAMALCRRIAEAAHGASGQPKFGAERRRLRSLELWAYWKQVEVEDPGLLPIDQADRFCRNIMMEAGFAGVSVLSTSKLTSRTNRLFAELRQNLALEAPEAQLLDFLGNVAASNSTFRVQSLSLHPAPDPSRLRADVAITGDYRFPAAGQSEEAAAASSEHLVLSQRRHLRQAALDCYNLTKSTLPAGWKLDSLNFQDGKRLSVQGTAPADQVRSLQDVRKRLEKAQVQGGKALFLPSSDKATMRMEPGLTNFSWSMQFELRPIESQ